MLTNCLKISDTTMTEFVKLIFFQRDIKNMSKILPCSFEQCFGPFDMLTVYKCSDTGLLRHLSNADFCSLKFEKQITSEVHIFFQSVQNFM